MAKFIEVHEGKQLRLVNLDMVQMVRPDGNNSTVLYVDRNINNIGVIIVSESYEGIRLMIGTAQGGIPMDRSGMY